MSNQFEDEDEESFKPVKGLKVNPSQSIPTSKKVTAERFNQQVDNIERNKKTTQGQLNTLTMSLLNVLYDKTLPVNKNALIKDNERQILIDLIEFCKTMDSDENESINAGSTSLIALLLSITLRQRDRLNEISYEIEELKKSKGKVT